MVFKPWSDTKTPRHLLQDESETFHKSTPPTITITDVSTPNLLVIPSTLSFIPDALSKLYKQSVLGSVNLTKANVQDLEEVTFDDEEQLYSAHLDPKTLTKSKLDIVEYPDLQLAVLVIPVYDNDNIINYNLISMELLKIQMNILTITPGTLPFHSSVATLSQSSKYPTLVPPFHITGISGSLVSKGSVSGIDIENLILQSEGVHGFEKIKEDAIDELVRYLTDKFKLSKQFKKELNNIWHTGKTVDNFGLYL